MFLLQEREWITKLKKTVNVCVLLMQFDVSLLFALPKSEWYSISSHVLSENIWSTPSAASLSFAETGL
jgi:hypothetical protein